MELIDQAHSALGPLLERHVGVSKLEVLGAVKAFHLKAGRDGDYLCLFLYSYTSKGFV